MTESAPATRHVTSGNLRGLIALNAALLVVLGVIALAPDADAQRAARGDYMMVGGNIPGFDGNAVYIVDTINQDMVVVAYSQSSKDLHPVAYRDLARDRETLVGQRDRPSR